MRNLKLSALDGVVKFAEWVKVEGVYTGKPPGPRVGNTLTYLPTLDALVVVGGRNDEICRGGQETIPFMNDVYVYSIEQKLWQ